MHSTASTAVYWRVDLPERAAALALLARVAQLPIRPLAGADLRDGIDQTTLFFRDDINSMPLVLLLRQLGQQIPASAVTSDVWAEPQLLRRALDGLRPPRGAVPSE